MNRGIRQISRERKAISGILSILGVISIHLNAIGTTPTLAAEPKPKPIISAIHIVSRVGDVAIASEAAKRARVDEPVRLFAVIETVVPRSGRAPRRIYYSDAKTIRIGHRNHPTRPLEQAPPTVWLWQKVEPSIETMSNTVSGGFRFEAIDYVETLMWNDIGASHIDADVHPTQTTDRGDGVGTMRYKLSALIDGVLLETAGKNARATHGRGGLTDAVHRITIRRDDSYLGYLTELFGQPYIWASAGRTDRTHQSELLEGSDCADFVVYGKRRMGSKIPYIWTGSLPDYTHRLAVGVADKSGVYRDNSGATIPFPNIGDLVLFPRHVGVLSQDRGIIGVLDHADIMMHSYFASPREQALGDSDYATSPTEIHRWKR